MGTIGSVWLMRPDGSLWDVDDDFGKPLQPLPKDLHVMALVAGTERHEWLVELIPPRPADALDCITCHGRGRICANPESNGFAYCPTCCALGWVVGPM
jgi:hypothetical protein